MMWDCFSIITYTDWLCILSILGLDKFVHYCHYYYHHCYLWIETRTIVQKCGNPGHIGIFGLADFVKFDGNSKIRANLDGWLWNITWQPCTLFDCHLWTKIGVIGRKPKNFGKICFNLCNIELWPLILTCCTDITLVSGDYTGKVDDDSMRRIL